MSKKDLSNAINLQQVPRNKEVRNLLCAPRGYLMAEFDVSQGELRIAADLSRDPKLIEAYNTGLDIHTLTASLTSGKSYEECNNKVDRKKAKPINFGFLYGMSSRKFQEYAEVKYGTKFSAKESVDIRNNFFNSYSGLITWHNNQKHEVRRTGQVVNRFGRIRHLPEIYSEENFKIAEAERQAINSPVQSLCSDILCFGMVNIYNELQKTGKIHIVGNVHDAVLLEIAIPDKSPQEAHEEVINICRQIKNILEDRDLMKKELGYYLEVPIVVDGSLGPWGKGKDIEDFTIEDLEEYM